KGEGGHVELGSAAVIVRAEREEPVPVRPQRAPAAGKMLFHRVKRERIVTGGDRRVRREHRGLANRLEGAGEGCALFDQIADALQYDEPGVPFVQVKHRWLCAERPERTDPANAEDDLLLD